jgi:hypothetical protein
MNRIARPSLVIAATLTVGCSQSERHNDETPSTMPDPFLCTENLVVGVVLEVRLAVTGEPAAYGATGVLRDRSYTEVLTVYVPGGDDPTQALRMTGAWERPRVYSVTVGKPGYLDWTGTAVVEADACHVHPVILQVMLQPQP